MAGGSFSGLAQLLAPLLGSSSMSRLAATGKQDRVMPQPAPNFYDRVAPIAPQLLAPLVTTETLVGREIPTEPEHHTAIRKPNGKFSPSIWVGEDQWTPTENAPIPDSRPAMEQMVTAKRNYGYPVAAQQDPWAGLRDVSAPFPPRPEQVTVAPSQAGLDRIQTGATKAEKPVVPDASGHKGFLGGFRDWARSDGGQAVSDFLLGLSGGTDLNSSLASGAKMLALGDATRRERKGDAEARTANEQFLISHGYSEADAKAIASNSGGLSAAIASIQAQRNPENQLDLQIKQAQLSNLQQGKPDEYAQRAAAARQFGLDPASEDGKAFILSGNLPEARGGAAELGLAPQTGVDADGNPVLIQLGKDGKAVQTALPPGVKLSKQPIKMDTGTEFILLDPVNREPIGRIPKDVAGAEAAKVAGKAQGEASFDLPRVEQNAEQTLGVLERLKTHPGRERSTGFIQGALPALSAEQVDFQSLVDQTQGQSFLHAFQSLKGGGQITEIEGAKATAAISRLGNQRLSDDDYLKAIGDLEDVIRAGLARAQRQAASGAPAASATAPASGDGWTDMGSGVRIRKVN